MGEDESVTEEFTSEQEEWDARYRENPRMWSGEPNAALVRETADLAAGTALDLGCGEGADAIWLARHGWKVTAVDFSGVALARAAEHGEAAGVADRIEWRQHDLAQSFPAGSFDLISAAFLHSYSGLPRERMLRTAAGAVSSGGVLLIVGHAGHAPWDTEHEYPELPDSEEVLAALELPEGEWEVLVNGDHSRVQAGPDGEPVTRTDNIVKVRRLTR